jgi:DNA-directed RNA polymerase specialized sigma24 family protein
MSLSWHEIRETMITQSSTLRFKRSFDRIRGQNSALDPFCDHAAVLEFLNFGTATPEQKNAVLSALVQAVQSCPGDAQSAQTILILALWPGLDGVRRRLSSRWRIGAADMAHDVLALACKGIAEMDLSRMNWIAATLLRNVERDLGRELLKDHERSAAQVETDPDDLPIQEGGGEMSQAELALAVEAVIGRDYKLVLMVALEGHTQAEAGAAMGLSEAAARKRYQRAIQRLGQPVH